MLPVRSLTLPPATHTNVWMPGRERFAIVDPGCHDEAEIARLLRVVERRAETGTPAAVVLTHEHADHHAGAAAVARALQLPLLGHADALDRVGATDLETRAIGDGDRIELGDVALQVHATPGHSPAHLSFRVEGRPVLISGDLLSGISTILVIPFEGHMGDYLNSLRRMSEIGVKVLLPGHGPPSPAAKLPELVAHREAREARIVAALEETGDLGALAVAAYIDQPGLPAALIEGQSLSHLLQLEREGRARRVDGDVRRWESGSPTI